MDTMSTRGAAGPRRTLAALVGLLAAACSSSPLLPEPGHEIIIAFDGGGDGWPADAWDLQDVAVADAELELTVGYSGGCRDHDFWLLAVDGWEPLPDAGPAPTGAVSALLAHDGHGDSCEAYITRELAFRVEPLLAAFREHFQTPGPGRILLRVPTGQGSTDTTTVEIPVPAAYPPD